ncbi:unnamed protein product [Rotaria socialis]|uniref:Uncharacterized protein n=1 Tax=Rotaria socialis TaxID=392032 RepID=A0A821N5H4_9BILA|nr:unnamed protein product [Rotaria socialis]
MGNCGGVLPLVHGSHSDHPHGGSPGQTRKHSHDERRRGSGDSHGKGGGHGHGNKNHLSSIVTDIKFRMDVRMAIRKWVQIYT